MRLYDPRHRTVFTAAAIAAVFFFIGMYSGSIGSRTNGPNMLEARVAALEHSKDSLRRSNDTPPAATCSCPPSTEAECPQVASASSVAVQSPNVRESEVDAQATPSAVPSPWSAEWAGGSAAVALRRESCDDCACKPFLSGQVDPARPPYFFPDADNQCKLRHFEPAGGLECVRGRRIFILGNSIARGFGFQIMNRFANASELDRKQQMQVCPKIGGVEEACELMGNGAAVKFLWMQFFDVKAGNMDGDLCDPLDARECLTRFLEDSRPGDVLLFYLGLHYAIERNKLVFGAPGFRFEKYVRDSISTFRETLRTVWHGRQEDVFRVRTALLRRRPPPDEQLEDLRIAWIDAANAMLDAASIGTPWHTIDQYGINWGQEHLYADNVHFPGVLSDITWNIVMSKLCPANTTST